MNPPETFWLDVVLRNPLNVEVEIADLTFHVVHQDGGDTRPADSFVDIETLDSLMLDPTETRTVHLPPVHHLRCPCSWPPTDSAGDHMSSTRIPHFYRSHI